MSETTPEPETVSEQANRLTVDNHNRMQHLAMKGIRIDLAQLTLRHLVEAIFPTDEQRAELNLSFQELLAVVLTEAEAQADRLTLQQAGSVPPGLFVPGQ